MLSKEKADFLRRWIELRKIHDTGEIITGKIVKRIKGGMVVDLKGVQAFLPGSQIDVRPVKDFDKYLDVEMDLKVVKFNEMRKNVVVSHKAILEESLAEKRDEIFSTLEVGAIMEGRVKNITFFCLFLCFTGCVTTLVIPFEEIINKMCDIIYIFCGVYYTFNSTHSSFC